MTSWYSGAVVVTRSYASSFSIISQHKRVMSAKQRAQFCRGWGKNEASSPIRSRSRRRFALRRDQPSKPISRKLVASGGKKYWINTANRYRKTATQTYANDVAATSIHEPSLIAYIAASAPAHLIDGWSYLARATEAILRGDLNAALHLAYYSELRAAMSLLACEGIGVFNNRHPIIEPSGTSTTAVHQIWLWQNTKFQKMRAGTHAAVWPLLNHWSSLKRAADLINRLVAPEGFPLRDWLNAVGIASPLRAISKGWFRSWGIDLSNLNDDHQSRNMVSYRPSEFRLPAAPTAQRAIDFVSNLWTLFEPTAGGRFPQLEKELLRKIVNESGQAVSGATLHTNMGIDLASATNWARFLANPGEPLPLTLADQLSDIESTDCSLQVMSRAALLLFLATGSTRKHLVDAGYSPQMLEFFWRRICEVRFAGPAASLPDDPIDMWRDIADRISEAKTWSDAAAPDTSLGEWRKIQPGVANQIVGFELAAVWGLVS